MKKKLLIVLLSMSLILGMMPLSCFAQATAGENEVATSNEEATEDNAIILVQSEAQLLDAIESAPKDTLTEIRITSINNLHLTQSIVIPKDKKIELDLNDHYLYAASGVEQLQVYGSLSLINDGSKDAAIEGTTNRIAHVYEDGNLNISGITLYNAILDAQENGGAILNYGICNIVNSIIANCSSPVVGGGIANYNYLTLTKSQVSSCSAYIGGGIFTAPNTYVQIINSTIDNCSAEESGGGFCSSGDASIQIVDSTIGKCSAGYNGGGMSTCPGDDIFFLNSTIEGCKALRDSGVSNSADYFTITGKCEIINNNNLDGNADNFGVDRSASAGAIFLDNLDPDSLIGLHLIPGWRDNKVVRAGGSQGFIDDTIFADYSGDTLSANDNGEMFIAVGIHPIITFDSQGGSEVAPMEVGIGEIVGHGPEEPVRSGYNFAGWYYEPECSTQFDFNRNYVMDNTTLYAKWEKAYDPTPVPPTPPVNPSDNTGSATQGGVSTGDAAMPIIFITLGFAAAVVGFYGFRRLRNR